MGNNKTKAMVAVLCAVILVIAGFGWLAGHDDVSRVRKTTQDNIDAFMEGIHSVSADTMAADDEAKELLQMLALLGVDADEFIRLVLNKISMEVGEVFVTKDTATAQVRLTAPDYASLDALIDRAGERIGALDTSGMDADQATAAVGDIIMDTLGEGLDTTSRELSFAYERVGDAWKITNEDEIEAAIDEAMGAANL